MLIAPKVGGIKVKGGTLKAEGQLAGTPSVLFDAVALVLTREAAAKLAEEGAAVDFVRDAFGHLKAIGCTPDADPLLQKAGVARDEGVTGLDKNSLARPASASSTVSRRCGRWRDAIARRMAISTRAREERGHCEAIDGIVTAICCRATSQSDSAILDRIVELAYGSPTQLRRLSASQGIECEISMSSAE